MSPRAISGNLRGNASSALRTGNGVMPPRPHSEPFTMVSQSSSSSARSPRAPFAIATLGAGCGRPARLRASSRCGRACTCRRIRWRRTRARNAPCAPCRPCRRTPRRRRVRAARPLPPALRSRAACRTATRKIGAERAADLHRAHRPAGRRAAAVVVNELCTVSPKARSTRPPRLTLPASCSGIVPRDLPMPKSR